ncbi:hypothetical protein PIB30_081108 [Stylosanthes scabra]|uniref:Uncharacterized protein n=1 Tax=Stylosanthes scabra TaxID=79078 RepID=A0ABU6STM0_9FABA|nr:hypothetical protein [Stylosanthes scabra]
MALWPGGKGSFSLLDGRGSKPIHPIFGHECSCKEKSAGYRFGLIDWFPAGSLKGAFPSLMEGVRNPSIPFLGMNVLTKKNRPVTGLIPVFGLTNRFLSINRIVILAGSQLNRFDRPIQSSFQNYALNSLEDKGLKSCPLFWRIIFSFERKPAGSRFDLIGRFIDSISIFIERLSVLIRTVILAGSRFDWLVRFDFSEL